MTREDIEFKSEGTTVRGWLYMPEGEGPFPGIAMAGGWSYVKEVVVQHYAKEFASRGLACVAFDYRCFGASDGEPREHIQPWWQIEDYKNALCFLEDQPKVDNDRLGVWGISYSGGHILILSATDPRVRCAVGVVPTIDGKETHRQVHGTVYHRQIMAAIAADRRLRYESGGKERGYLPMSSPNPDEELCAWPVPEIYEGFMGLQKTDAPAHVHRQTIESLELYYSYSVRPYLERITEVPVQLVLTEGDDLTPVQEELEAFNAIASPHKNLALLKKTSHMKIYSNKSHMQIAAERSADWFVEHMIEEH